MPPLALLHVFTPMGKTFTFRQVTRLVTNESTLSFDYTVMSDGHTKHAVFYIANIAGFSVSEVDATVVYREEAR